MPTKLSVKPVLKRAVKRTEEKKQVSDVRKLKMLITIVDITCHICFTSVLASLSPVTLYLDSYKVHVHLLQSMLHSPSFIVVTK